MIKLDKKGKKYANKRRLTKREFGAFDRIRDNAPKYVMSLDKFDLSQNGIAHINIIDFLLEKRNIELF